MSEVTVVSVPNELEAEQLCALLRTEGIAAYFTSHDGLQGLGEMAYECQIKVRPEDAERAAELVAAGR